ncbi:cation:proton antiporter [Microbacterium sp.]|uniref:cation:proton antiporter n=1 Tax=Microbacterium sp. TaxID=51671 RepID=UPI003A8CFEAE
MSMAQLALVCAVALIGPLLALPRRARIPVVVGELLAGVAIGASGLRLVDASDPTFAFLGGQIGFALVMFVVGTHVPLRSAALRSGLGAGAARAAVVGALAVPAGLGLAALFGTHNGLLYAVLIASSSAAIILPSLGKTPLDGRPLVAMIAQVAIADTACIVLLPLAIDPTAALRRFTGALTVVAASIVLYLLLRLVEHSDGRRRLRAVSEARGFALELRISLVLLFAIVALAQALGVTPMLAGFGAGLAVAAVGEPRRLARQLLALSEGFFAPLFFVWLGAGLGLAGVGAHPQLLAVGLGMGVAAAVVHGVMVVGRQPWPIALLTCAQLGVPVAAVALGRTQGVLAPGEDAALLIGAVITVAIAAAVNGRVTRIAEATTTVRHPAPGGNHSA